MIREHRLIVRRTARYCTLGTGADARSVWYVLHGYRQLAERFIGKFRALESPGRLIVAPEALNRFYIDDARDLTPHGPDSPVGATWMTRHDREAEIEDYVAYLDDLDAALDLGPDVRRIVLGFSQGAATAARWATRGRVRADRLVLWSGLLPSDPGEGRARLGTLRPVYVAGEADPALSVAAVEAERRALQAAGVESALVRHAGGHAIDADALRAVAGLVDA